MRHRDPNLQRYLEGLSVAADRHPFHGNAYRGGGHCPTQEPVSNRLPYADDGYHTVLGGLQHIAADPAVIGFDERLSPATRSVKDVAPTVAEFLRSAPHQPFFLDAGFFETHREFPPVAPDVDPGYARPPVTLPDTPETREDMAAYMTMARQLDDGYAIILGALEEAGLAENTLVIATTDHGVAFPGCKCNLTDHGMGVMLILRGPGGFGGGRACAAMVSQIDIFPTLCDLLEIEAPEWLQGESMMALIRNEVVEINDEIFAEVTYHAAYEPKRAIRTKRYKYIHVGQPHRRPFAK